MIVLSFKLPFISVMTCLCMSILLFYKRLTLNPFSTWKKILNSINFIILLFCTDLLICFLSHFLKKISYLAKNHKNPFNKGNNNIDKNSQVIVDKFIWEKYCEKRSNIKFHHLFTPLLNFGNKFNITVAQLNYITVSLTAVIL